MDKRHANNQPSAEQLAVENVERAADEPILSAMVKTAIHKNMNAVNAKQSAPVTWMDVEQSGWDDQSGWEDKSAQNDGFRYDYDDNI